MISLIKGFVYQLLFSMIQYARALRERGVEVKVIVFPEDVHGIERLAAI